MFEYQPNRQQLKRLINEFRSAPSRNSIRDTLLSVYLQQVEAIDFLSRGINQGFDEVEDLIAMGINWDMVARRLKTRFDEVSAKQGKADFDPIYSSLNFFEILQIAQRSLHIANDFESALVSDTVFEARRRTECGSNVWLITMAMLLYEKDHGCLPPAFTTDSAGDPLHSWRVLLLPYLGHQKLYDQIRLQEPWNSLHNRKFFKQIPSVYRCPNLDQRGVPSDQTSYSVVAGPGMAFERDRKVSLSDYGPDSDDLILVLERNDSVSWMQPDNELNQADAEAQFSSSSTHLHPAGIHVGFRKESMEILPQDTEISELRDRLLGISKK